MRSRAAYTGGITLAKAAKKEPVMSDRPRFFNDLAGVAGGALSALTGLRDEAEALVRARVDETIRRLDLVRRDEFDALAQLAANAREGQEAADTRIAALEARIAALEERLPVVNGPGMVA
jgi:BMFP domain-containing protein YqiC